MTHLLPISTALAKSDAGRWAVPTPLARRIVRGVPSACQRVRVRRSSRGWACPPALAARLYREAGAPSMVTPAPMFLSVRR